MDPQGSGNHRSTSISVGGNVEGQNVVVGGTQSVHGDLRIIVGALEAASDDVRVSLREQIDKLVELLEAVPAEQTDQVQRIKVAAEDVVDEAAKERPDKKRLKFRGDMLKKTAEGLAAIAPTVLTIASQIVTIIAKIG